MEPVLLSTPVGEIKIPEPMITPTTRAIPLSRVTSFLRPTDLLSSIAGRASPLVSLSPWSPVRGCTAAASSAFEAMEAKLKGRGYKGLRSHHNTEVSSRFLLNKTYIKQLKEENRSSYYMNGLVPTCMRVTRKAKTSFNLSTASKRTSWNNLKNDFPKLKNRNIFKTKPSNLLKTKCEIKTTLELRFPKKTQRVSLCAGKLQVKYSSTRIAARLWLVKEPPLKLHFDRPLNVNIYTWNPREIPPWKLKIFSKFITE